MTTDLIRDGYDRIAAQYAKLRDQTSSTRHLERLDRLLRPNSLVLDLGCGAGMPVDRWLIDRGHRVIGLDISDAMLALARRNVPEAQCELRDIAELERGFYGVDAVVSFFALFHVDRRRHKTVLACIRSYMPKGGALLITTGRSHWEGRDEFLGVEMAWSHFDREASRRLIEESGFAIVHEDRHRGNSPGDDDWHPLFLARAD